MADRLRRASLWQRLALLLFPALLVVTGLELWMTRHDALAAANAAYDRSLLGALKSIDANISTASGGLSVELPYTMFEFFELTASGQVFFRVATSDGLVELGSADLPAPPEELKMGVPAFYDATYFGEAVRLAAYRRDLDRAPAGSTGRSVLIQVGESTRSRQAFSARFVRSAALRDGLVLALLLCGTAIALAAALRPLSRLAREVQARTPDDLTRIAETDLPAEVRPLVAAVNQQMSRTQDLVTQQRQFLDDASHQLRTHLTTLQMQADYAKREQDPVQVQAALDALGTEIGRATRSAQQLLFVLRNTPLTSAFYALRAQGSAAVIPARADEHDEVCSIIKRFEGHNYAVINPGAAWPNKRWPPARFGAVAALIAREFGWRSLVLWGPGEQELAHEVVATSSGAAEISPPTTITDLVGVARNARLMISGDTGPLHIAGAVNTPIVALYGPTRPERNGPWGLADVALSRVQQCSCVYERKCRKTERCIDDISVAEVISAVQRRVAA